MGKKNGVRKVNFAEFVERTEAAGATDIEMPSGWVLRVPPPELWSDEVGARFKDGDLTGAARAVVGVEDYDRFVSEGGSANALNAIVAEAQGADMGESAPSPSS